MDETSELRSVLERTRAEAATLTAQADLREAELRAPHDAALEALEAQRAAACGRVEALERQHERLALAVLGHETAVIRAASRPLLQRVPRHVRVALRWATRSMLFTLYVGGAVKLGGLAHSTGLEFAILAALPVGGLSALLLGALRD